MLPTVSNMPTSNVGKELSNVVRRNSDLSETQYYQIQYLSNDAVVGCSSAGGTAISDFSVESAAASGTVLAGVKDKKAKKDTGSHAGERSAAQSSECHGNKHACDTCGRAFKKISQLRLHRLIHNDKRSYECDLYDKTSKTQNCFTKHKSVHLGIKKHICHECGKSFHSSSNLTKHQSVHSTTNKLFECTTCYRRYKSKQSLTIHQMVHSGKRQYLCDMCGKGFKRYSELENHIPVHRKERPYNCLFYDKDFKSTRTLNQHIRQNHKSQQDEIKSIGTLLKKQNVDGGSMVGQSHPMNHHGDRVESGVKCDFYEKRFVNLYKMTEHKVAVHSDKDEGAFQCKHCGKGFANKMALNHHIKNSHPLAIVGEFKCNGSDAVFPDKVALSMHKISSNHRDAVKLGVREYCDKEFSDLNKHNLAFRCEHCSQCFAHEILLSQHHTDKHPDKKPDNHPCNYCDKSFCFAYLLTEHHFYFHSDKVPGDYECPKCNKKCFSRSKLEIHRSLCCSPESVTS